jgi:hypothetical protein
MTYSLLGRKIGRQQYAQHGRHAQRRNNPTRKPPPGWWTNCRDGWRSVHRVNESVTAARQRLDEMGTIR